MNRLEELAELCEKATGPDRELDAAIWLTLRADAASLKAYEEGLKLSTEEAAFRLSYMSDSFSPTASLDAAMTLVPDNCAVDLDNGPCHWLCLGKQEQQIGRADVKYPKPGYNGEGDSWLTASAIAKTMPLALCAAALRARATQHKESSNGD